MPELNHILGAILRDVAQARVISDAFSRNASLEYERDDLLRAFPVPRLEIQQASIDLKFAVTGVKQKEPDRERVIRLLVQREGLQLRRSVVHEVITTDPRRQEIEEAIAAKGLMVDAKLEEALVRTLTDDPQAIEAALAGNADGLAEKLGTVAADTLLEDETLRDLLTRRPTVTEIRERIAAVVKGTLERLASAGGDPDAVPRELLADVAAELASNVVGEVVETHPRRSEILSLARERRTDLVDVEREAAARALLEDRDALAEAIKGNPEALEKRVAAALAEPLLETPELRAALTRRPRVGDVRQQIAAVVRPSVTSFAKDLSAALEAEKKSALTVEVAVTADELANVSEERVSQLNVVSQIRNYEWVSIEEEGVDVTRLQPE